MKEKLTRFAPVKIGVEESAIPEQHRPVLTKLVAAARQMDRLFLLQVARENPTWRAEIASQANGESTRLPPTSVPRPGPG